MYVGGATNAIQAQTQTQSTSDPLGTGDVTQTFLTLLMTQLKTQDPLSPMDPTQMVGQLVQLNTLGEIMSIRQLLETQVPQQTGASASQAVEGGK